MPQRLSKEDFVLRSQIKHGTKYDYSRVEYVNNSTKVIIICKKCDIEFHQAPNYHLLGTGCPACGRRRCDKSRSLTTETFIDRASKIHNGFYDYYKTKYIHNSQSVIIQCPIHGEFTQVAYTHLKGHGCQACGKLGFSQKCLRWIRNIEKEKGITIQHIMNGGEYCIPGTRFKADGYCKETNTIYEFYGDKWHGNKDVYLLTDKCHPFSDKTVEQLYNKTISREQQIQQLGYNIVSIWEYDFDGRY